MKIQTNGIAWNSVGAFGYLALHAISMVLVARLDGAAALGQFLLAQAIGVPLARLCALRYHEMNATERTLTTLKNHYRNVSMFSIPLTALTCTLWFLLVSGPSSYSGIMLILANVLAAYAHVSQGRLLRLSLFMPAAGFEILRGVLSVLSFSVGLWVFSSFTVATALLFSTWAVAALIEAVYATKASADRDSSDQQVISVSERLRYALSDSVSIFQISSVRLVIAALLDQVAVGIFGAATLLIKLLQPAATAVAKTLMPQLAAGLKNGDRQQIVSHIRAIHLATIILTIVLVPVGYWLTAPLIELLMGEELRPPTQLATIIMLGAAPLLGSRWLMQVLVAFRYRAAVERVSWIGLGCTLVLALPLVSYFSLTGAAIAATTGYIVRYILCTWHVHAYVLQIQLNPKDTSAAIAALQNPSR